LICPLCDKEICPEGTSRKKIHQAVFRHYKKHKDLIRDSTELGPVIHSAGGDLLSYPVFCCPCGVTTAINVIGFHLQCYDTPALIRHFVLGNK
jgi:hypothetical protein